MNTNPDFPGSLPNPPDPLKPQNEAPVPEEAKETKTSKVVKVHRAPARKTVKATRR